MTGSWHREGARRDYEANRYHIRTLKQSGLIDIILRRLDKLCNGHLGIHSTAAMPRLLKKKYKNRKPSNRTQQWQLHNLQQIRVMSETEREELVQCNTDKHAVERPVQYL